MKVEQCQRESSCCWKCRSRNTCKMKDVIAGEEAFVYGCAKHLQVTAQCSNFIFDHTAMKPVLHDFMQSILGK